MPNRDRSVGDTGKKQTYFKHNYVEYVDTLVPAHQHRVYYNEYGEEQDIAYKALGSVLLLAANAETVFSVSDVSATGNLDGSSFYPYFVPTNKKNSITSDSFYRDILRPLGANYDGFTTEGEFRNFLLSSVLPQIHTNTPTNTFIDGAYNKVASTLGTASACHEYLSDKLGILYFLNTSGESVSVDPSSFVASALAGFAFSGTKFTEGDAIATLLDYAWANRGSSSSLNLLIPPDYRKSDAEISGLTYVSGTQLVEGLKTLARVFYDDSENSELIKDSLDSIIVGGSVPGRKKIGGPFFTFLQALSYAFYDYRSAINDVQDLLDIEKCPPQFLDYLASYIGWKLVSDDIDSWRSQLRQAIYIYKSKGTRKSLESALKLVFPQGVYNPSDPVSGLVESWESYVPSMVYYMIRTESYISNSVDQFDSMKKHYDVLQGITDNIHANINTRNLDDSYRFLVDSVLERLDEKLKFIKLNGVHYKETEFWKRQGNDAHYYHRGSKVYVPPWEVDRFYDRIPLSPSILDELEEILTSGREKGGFEIPKAYVSSMRSFLDGLSEVTTQDQLPLGLADNGRFKVFSRTRQLPPNYEKVVTYGNTDHISLLDYYNSKSSHVFVQLDADSFDFTYKDFRGLGESAINTINDMFYRFAPFHVAVKISLLQSFDDTKNPTPDIFCFVGEKDQDEFNSTVNNSYSVSGFTFVSGLGLSGSNLRTVDGRVVPATSGVLVGNLGRTSFRRRGLVHLLPSPACTRNGLSNPIGITHYSLSSVKDSVLFNTPYWTPLGFNFSSQSYTDTTGAGSGVWDASNNISMGRSWIQERSASFNGIPVSSTWPIRGISDSIDSCSSSPATRSHSLAPITRVVIDELIRRGDYDFSLDNLNGFNFGYGMHKLYRALSSFSSINRAIDPPGQIYLPFAGGYNLISHMYGPLVENSGFDHSGIYSLSSVQDTALDKLNPRLTPSRFPQVKYVAAPEVVEGHSYAASAGSSVVIQVATLKNNVLNTYINDVDSQYSNVRYSNRGILSGVEISCDNKDSFAVSNKKDSPYQSGFSDNNNSVSLYKYGSLSPDEGVILRFPLERNHNKILNGKITHTPKGLSLKEADTSSVANWVFNDSTTHSTLTGTASVSGISFGYGNQPSAIVLSGAGVSNAKAYTEAGGRGRNDFKSLQTLHPNNEYEFSFSAGNLGSGNLLFSLVNNSKSESYNGTTKSWDSGVSVNVLNSLGYTWTKHSYPITIPDDHSAGDSYELLFSVSGTAGGSTVYFTDLQMSGTKDNLLEKDSEYHGTIKARFASESADYKEQTMQVRIITNVTPHIGFGNNNSIYAYNFDTRKWEDATSNHWKDYRVTLESKAYEFDFETIGTIHENQSYFVEIRPKHSVGSYAKQACLIISDVSLFNKKYNSYVEGYEKIDFVTIMNFFNSAAESSHSRSTTYTEDYGVSGGSRHSYLDYPVGDSGTFEFRDNDY